MTTRAVAARGPRPLDRAARLLLAFVLACGVVITSALLGTRPAYAADDLVQSLDLKYKLQPSGNLHVQETWVWQFGSNSGRHGICRFLVIREPYDDKQDAVYTVTNINVTSPDSGVSTEWKRDDTSSQKGREETMRIRIGDANQTVSAPTATYVISYDVAGALRTFPNEQQPYDEFFWDATGTGNPAISQVRITAAVPGGPYQGALSCFAGPVQSTTPCSVPPKVQGDAGVFAQDDLAAGDNVSIGVKIKPGAVAVVTPDLQPRADVRSPGENAAIAGAGIAVGAAAVASPLLGVAY